MAEIVVTELGGQWDSTHQVMTENTAQLAELRAERDRLQARITELNAAITALEGA